MDTNPSAHSAAGARESEDDRRNRLAWEAAALAEARAAVAAGHVVPWEAVHAWIESLETEDELPPPGGDD